MGHVRTEWRLFVRPILDLPKSSGPRFTLPLTLSVRCSRSTSSRRSAHSSPVLMPPAIAASSTATRVYSGIFQ